MKIKYIYIMAAILGFSACQSDDDLSVTDEVVLPELKAGDAVFSTYVSLGASFTAGFVDGGLFIASQENSFPNTLAKQFAKAGGGVFSQPLMNDNFGGLTLAGNRIGNPRLVFGGAGPVPLESIIGPVTVGTEVTMSPTGPFNNLGVPGAKSFHLVTPGFGNITNLSNPMIDANPYAVRLTGATPDATMLDLAVDQNPTFFTLNEIGGNDVLGYATTGGDGTNPITDAATFTNALAALINGLTANGAKGAIGNLPNITGFPFFTTIPNNALDIDATTAANLTGFFQAVTAIFTGSLIQQGIPPAQAQALAAQYAITFNEGPNRFLIDVPVSPTNPLGFRQMTEEELLLLTIDQSALATGYGSVVLTPEVVQILGILQMGGTPTPQQAGAVLAAVSGIDDKDALDTDEIAEIAIATMEYNNSIQAAADSKGLAVADLNKIFEAASTTGIEFDEFTMNTDLVFGGVISLDGVHPTPRGYALIANAFLKAIDKTYGSNFIESGNPAKATDFVVNFSPSLQ